MKKGQGATKRKSLLETIYGPAAAGEAGRHIALLHEYDFAVCTLELLEHVIATHTATDEQAVMANVEKVRQRIPELKELVFQSWEKVRRQPQTLLKLATVAERIRDDDGVIYHVEFSVLTMYQAGERSHKKLLEFAAKVNPKIDHKSFRRITERYNLVTIKERPGRPALTQKRA